jgi:hypothetical protein
MRISDIEIDGGLASLGPPYFLDTLSNTVIASEAKQGAREELDCFVAALLAMTDGHCRA